MMGWIAAYSVVGAGIAALIAFYIFLWREYQGVLEDDRNHRKWMRENS